MENPTANSGSQDSAEGRLPQRVPWTAVQGFGLVAIYILIQAGVLHLAWAWGMDETDLSFQIGASNALMLLAIYFILKGRAGGGSEALRAIAFRAPNLGDFRRLVKPVVLGAMAVFAALAVQIAISTYLRKSFGVEFRPQEVVARMRIMLNGGQWTELAMLAFLAVFVVPVAEELTFRGLLYLPLRSVLGQVRGALIVSAVFSALHQHVEGLLPLFVLALVFTWMMEAAGTIVAPILGHAFYNASMVALFLLTGGKVG